MKKILILFLFATLLFSQNRDTAFLDKNCSIKTPKVYSALGNGIYYNVDKIAKLKYIKPYYSYVLKIDNYVYDVKKAKQLGFDIETGYKAEEKANYLNEIRKLSKINDFFKKSVEGNFKASILNKDSEVFSQIINNGLVDTLKYRDKILLYYETHSDDINSTGVIQEFLDDDERIRKSRKSKKVVNRKKESQEQKIKRLRDNDRARQEAIYKALEEKLMKTKREIRREQIKQLAN